jgi:hypothetical protein
MQWRSKLIIYILFTAINMVPWLLHYLVNMTQTTFALAVQLKLLLRYQSIMIMDAFEYLHVS